MTSSLPVSSGQRNNTGMSPWGILSDAECFTMSSTLYDPFWLIRRNIAIDTFNFQSAIKIDKLFRDQVLLPGDVFAVTVDVVRNGTTTSTLKQILASSSSLAHEKHSDVFSGEFYKPRTIPRHGSTSRRSKYSPHHHF